MDGGVHAQFPHARELRRVELIDVREHPAQVLDRVLLVDRLDLIEEAVDRVRQVGVDVQRQVILGDFGRDLAPQRQLLRLRIGLLDEHRIVQRPVDALAVEDVIDVVVALEQLHLGDARQRALDLLGGVADADAVDAVGADVELVLGRPFLVEADQVRIASSHAERGEPGAIEVLDHAERAGLDRGRRRLRELADQPAEAGFGDPAGRDGPRCRARPNRSPGSCHRCPSPAARGY